MGNEKIELTEEQLAGVTGGAILPDGRMSYGGQEFALSTEQDYENVLSQFGEGFGPAELWVGAEEGKMWAAYYDWYYNKFGNPHPLDGR